MDKPADNEKVKKRKIRKTDWLKVEEYLKKELQTRKDNPFRKTHEKRWKEVDRQIQMEAIQKTAPAGKSTAATWQSAFELGELSKASEVITADVMRLLFPQNRTWMEAHCKPPKTVDEATGKARVAVDQSRQKAADGILRAFMTQQHMDFGLKARVEISVKEALHHGSYVSTAEWDTQSKVHDGSGLETLGAPVWKPHSMWNCYPDSSPSVIPGGSIFYAGSMMIVSYMPRYKVLALSGDGYMNINATKIPKKNPNKEVKEEDCEIVTYYGDLVIEREDGDIYLPNSKCMTANGVVIFYAPNKLPFPPVIYGGYERQDIRDPYFTSPIEKNSPIQKLATIFANKFSDVSDLHGNPPIVYDGNDPYMVANGGLNYWPGGQTASRGSNKFQEIKIGDPKPLLLGAQFFLQKLEEGTAVNAIRSGAGDSDRKTATEVRDTQQGSEIRTIDFVSKVEPGGLRPFLYMQHELNRQNLKSYAFYCPEKGLPDFLTITKKELPDSVHFEVVGSKGILGEERRSQQMTGVTAFASQNPLFAPLLNAPKILIDMYEDAGVKGAEEYVNTQKQQIPPQVQAQMQQMQQAMQQMQAELQKAKSGEAVAMQKLNLDKMKAEADLSIERAKLEMEKVKATQEMKTDASEVVAKANESIAKLEIQRKEMMAKYELEAQQIRNDFALRAQELELQRQNDKEELRIKEAAAKAKAAEPVKVKRTKEGYEVGGKKMRRTAEGFEVS
jgi:hypothetical protein